MKTRVVALQQPLHEAVSEMQKAEIKALAPDFVCLPEHYPLSKEVKNITEAANLFEVRKQYLQTLSADLGCSVVGGTITEKTSGGYYNTCFVFRNGKELGFYRKVFPTDREREAGVLQGNEFKSVQVEGLRVGILICADVLNDHSFGELSQFACQIVFVPTASPYRANETWEEKSHRDNGIFLRAAQKLGCPLIKTCGVGSTFGHRIQGRSLIVTPDGIVARVMPDGEDRPALLFAELDI